MTSEMGEEYSVEVEVDGKVREVFAGLYGCYIHRWDEVIDLDWVGHYYYNEDGEVVTLPDDYVLAVDYRLYQVHADTIYQERISEW
jgi:hypothetical protein